VSAVPKVEPEERAQGPLNLAGAEIDAVLCEAKGDLREAIRVLLRGLATMALDGDAASSRGFLRGQFSEGNRRSPWIEEV
jgi:hypothetical protein